VFVGLAGVVEGQVVQETLDRFTVRVVTEAGFGDEQVKEIQKRFNDRLGPVTVRVERVSALERTSRGKIRAVISHIRRGDPAPDAGGTSAPAPADKPSESR
jgi:FKBP-type peptidyl-prolyl cis-trans isomerase 2